MSFLSSYNQYKYRLGSQIDVGWELVSVPAEQKVTSVGIDTAKRILNRSVFQFMHHRMTCKRRVIGFDVELHKFKHPDGTSESSHSFCFVVAEGLSTFEVLLLVLMLLSGCCGIFCFSNDGSINHWIVFWHMFPSGITFWDEMAVCDSCVKLVLSWTIFSESSNKGKSFAEGKSWQMVEYDLFRLPSI